MSEGSLKNRAAASVSPASVHTERGGREEGKGKEKKKEEKAEEMAEMEFTIAADLTLYANPLRCLKKTAKPPVPQVTFGPDMIAADLVKYGSPLDDN